MGVVVNPEGAIQQMEGCLTMGLGYTLSEEVHFKGGEVLSRSFDSYELPRFSWLPKIETVIVDAPGRAVAGRRRAGARAGGRGRGERDLRRDRRAADADADDGRTREGGARKGTALREAGYFTSVTLFRRTGSMS